MSEPIDFYIEGAELRSEPYRYLESGLDNIFLLRSSLRPVFHPMLNELTPRHIG